MPSKDLPLVGAACTLKRLWFLYFVAGLSPRDIAALTEWDQNEIEERLDRWGLEMFTSDAYRRTVDVLLQSVIPDLQREGALDSDVGPQTALVEFREHLRGLIDARLMRWGMIEKFLAPEEIEVHGSDR